VGRGEPGIVHRSWGAMRLTVFFAVIFKGAKEKSVLKSWKGGGMEGSLSFRSQSIMIEKIWDLHITFRGKCISRLRRGTQISKLSQTREERESILNGGTRLKRVRERKVTKGRGERMRSHSWKEKNYLEEGR